MYFFGFSTWGFIFYVTTLGLMVLGLGSDVFFWFYDLWLLFLCYYAWFNGVGFMIWCIFLVFQPEASFSNGVGFRFWCIFLVFRPEASFSVSTLGLRVSGLGSDVLFFLFFVLRLLFLCYCALFKGVGFRFCCSFLVSRPEASFSMLLRLV